MSGRFVRASKYRHVFGEAARKDGCFNNYGRVSVKGDGNTVEANGEFVAVPMQGGGGPVQIASRAKPERLAAGAPTLNVHSSSVVDMEFSPFLSNVLATASEDCRAGVTVLPEGGLSENITAADGVTTLFQGHQKKVNYVRFHPTANVLATSSADNTIKVWDLIQGEEIFSVDSSDLVSDVQFNGNGSLVATLSKDKKLRLLDPRVADQVQSTDSFAGTKASKVFWANNHGLVGGVGFNQRSMRQYALWDPRNFEKPLVMSDLEQAAGIMFPHYDEDTSMLYIAGKGDGSIKYFEITEEKPHVFSLSQFRDSDSTKGIGWLPKRFCDVGKCEVAMAYRLLRDNIMPISFQVPRKSDLFQADLFPDTYAGVPSLTPEAYAAGENAEPTKVSMKPGAAAAAGPSSAAAALPAKSRAQLQKELDEANATIEELRAEIAKLKA